MAEERTVTIKELREHNSQGDLWLAIAGKVYDVSSFMDDHPGGAHTLLDCAGIDGTVEFEDIGHSESAREQMAGMLVGRLADGESFSKSGAPAGSGATASAASGSSAGMVVPIVVILLAIAFFLFQDQILGAAEEAGAAQE